ncbi:hypothetical protein ACM66B_006455 [Microbotryomycetes sp. NB124-2]
MSDDGSRSRQRRAQRPSSSSSSSSSFNILDALASPLPKHLSALAEDAHVQAATRQIEQLSVSDVSDNQHASVAVPSCHSSLVPSASDTTVVFPSPDDFARRFERYAIVTSAWPTTDLTMPDRPPPPPTAEVAASHNQHAMSQSSSDQGSTSTHQSSSTASGPPVTPARTRQSNSSSTPVQPQTSAAHVTSLTDAERVSVRQAIAGRVVEVSSIHALLGQLQLGDDFKPGASSERQPSSAKPGPSTIGSKMRTLEAEAAAEAVPQRKQANPGQHWFVKLAKLDRDDQDRPLAPQPHATLQFVNDPNKPLMQGRVQSCRKPDAYLAFPGQVTNHGRAFEHIAVILEFTSEKKLTRLNLNAPQDKYLQVLGYMRDTLASQPMRAFVLGVCVIKRLVALLVMDREVVRIAYLTDCWRTGAQRFRILARLLLNMDPACAGLSPLATFVSDPQHGLLPFHLPAKVFDATSSNLDLRRVDIVFASSPGSSAFSRATTVIKLAAPLDGSNERRLVIKVQNVDDNRTSREIQVWEPIAAFARRNESWAKGGNRFSIEILEHLAAVDRAVVYERMPWQTPADILDKYSRVVKRHTEAVVYLNPTENVVPLTSRTTPPRPSEVVTVIKTLVAVLYELNEGPQVLHRDVSTGNVLHNFGSLVLSDWDCGWAASMPDSQQDRRQRTGTMDTMATEVLDSNKASLQTRLVSGFVHLLRHDLESAVYVFIKVLWFHLYSSASKEEKLFWEENFGFNDANMTASALSGLREKLWSAGKVVLDTLFSYMSAISSELAELVWRLFDQPLSSISATSAARPDFWSRRERLEDNNKAIVDKLYSDFRQTDLDRLDEQMKASDRWPWPLREKVCSLQT